MMYDELAIAGVTTLNLFLTLSSNLTTTTINFKRPYEVV